MGGWGQPRLLCVVMAASELMGARVFVWEDCVGVCAAWRRADALCVCVCVCALSFFFSLCLFCLCVSLAFLFLLRFFFGCFVFF